MKRNAAANTGSGMKLIIIGNENSFRVIQGFNQLHAVF